MFRQMERRNREVWEDHPTMLEDATHVIGGVGLGLLLYPALQGRAKAAGWAMVMISAGLHCYADMVKPSSPRLMRRRRSKRGVLGELLRR